MLGYGDEWETGVKDDCHVSSAQGMREFSCHWFKEKVEKQILGENY